jgi:hypothetical protein
MGEERMRVLKMVAEGKISVAEADELLSALGVESDETASTAATGSALNDGGTVKNRKKPAYMKVKVNSANNDNVDVKVPLNLLRTGIRLTSLIPKPALEQINNQMKDRGLDFDLTNFKPSDIEELIEAISELEVNVDSKNGDKVKVYCE